MPPISTSPRLALPYLQPAQAQKHVTHNEALQLLDAVVQLRIQDFDLVLPPNDPLPGDVVAVGAGATGDWAGQDGRLALWDGTGWQFVAPREGWMAWDAATRGLGGAWVPFLPALQNLPGLGVGTTSDAGNRLAVASDATLLGHDGAGHQLKVNKAGATDTASLVFQSGWTGHAEMGLAGGLDFSLKVSDGTSWATALSAARATGVVTLPQGAAIGGPVTGAAVQASPTDATPGRLLTAGAFGLGGPLPPLGDASAAGTIPPASTPTTWPRAARAAPPASRAARSSTPGAARAWARRSSSWSNRAPPRASRPASSSAVRDRAAAGATGPAARRRGAARARTAACCGARTGPRPAGTR